MITIRYKSIRNMVGLLGLGTLLTLAAPSAEAGYPGYGYPYYGGGSAAAAAAGGGSAAAAASGGWGSAAAAASGGAASAAASGPWGSAAAAASGGVGGYYRGPSYGGYGGFQPYHRGGFAPRYGHYGGGHGFRGRR